MGDRVIYNIKQKDGMYVSLYSHWGGSEALSDLAKALQAAKPRWNDHTYCARIIVSQLVNENWNDVLGFGLWASNEPSDSEKQITIDIEQGKCSGGPEWGEVNSLWASGWVFSYEDLIESMGILNFTKVAQ